MIEKELLLKARLFEEDYEIEGVGTVRIRLLSWEECLQQQEWTAKGKPLEDVTARVLHLAMIDPALTIDEVKVWMGNAPGGEIQELLNHIIHRSGLEEGAQKSV